MRAAIYSRFSTDRQNESSIVDQVRVCTEYAQAHGMTITHRFKDEGISGAAIGNRPGCVAMLEAAKAKAFDVLLITDTSRLSRSSGDLSKIADRMVFMGLRILAVQEAGADTAKDGWEIYFGLSGLMGQQFRKMTSKKTHTALESRAQGGKWTGGRCYGYTTRRTNPADPRSMVLPEVEEGEAAIVREIFSRFANGETMRAIARDLTARLIPAPRGRAWHVSAIQAMLHNDRYTGRAVWNRSLWRKDPDTGIRRRIERPEAEHTVRTDERLRLVDDATWQRVRLRDPLFPHSKARPKYALSGLLLCGECGRPMTLTGGANARGYGRGQRYVCPNYREHGKGAHGCANDVGVSRSLVEELLIDPLRARLLEDGNCLSALKAWLVQKERTAGLQWDHAMGELVASAPAPVSDPAANAALATKLEALKAAELAGVLTGREAAERARTFKAEHERAAAGFLPSDPASIVANAEALQAALESRLTDALRDALRRTLGSVRCQPTTEEDGDRYLTARWEGGDMALMEWLSTRDPINKEGRSAVVAGAGFGCVIQLRAA